MQTAFYFYNLDLRPLTAVHVIWLAKKIQGVWIFLRFENDEIMSVYLEQGKYMYKYRSGREVDRVDI